VEVAGEKYDVIGGAVCGAFVVFGGLAVVGYGPWRRRVDRWRAVHAPAVEDEAYADDGIDGEASSNAAQSSPENGKAGVVVHVAETDGEAGGSRS
jgi:high-affinity nickel-transport protein